MNDTFPPGNDPDAQDLQVAADEIRSRIAELDHVITDLRRQARELTDSAAAPSAVAVLERPRVKVPPRPRLSFDDGPRPPWATEREETAPVGGAGDAAAAPAPAPAAEPTADPAAVAAPAPTSASDAVEAPAGVDSEPTIDEVAADGPTAAVTPGADAAAEPVVTPTPVAAPEAAVVPEPVVMPDPFAVGGDAPDPTASAWRPQGGTARRHTGAAPAPAPVEPSTLTWTPAATPAPPAPPASPTAAAPSAPPSVAAPTAPVQSTPSGAVSTMPDRGSLTWVAPAPSVAPAPPVVADAPAVAPWPVETPVTEGSAPADAATLDAPSLAAPTERLAAPTSDGFGEAQAQQPARERRGALDWDPFGDEASAAFDRFFSAEVEPEPAQRWLLSD